MARDNLLDIGATNSLQIKKQPNWNWKKQKESLKNRCIGCEFACDETEKQFCDPDGGAAK